MSGRILYVQYTDPAGYPPLDHSAQILARAGWDVVFAGIEAYGTRGIELNTHERIRVLRVGGRSGGLAGPLKYALYHLRMAALARSFRPDWIYASDMLAAGPALAARRVASARLLYHEHDAPTRRGGKLDRLVFAAREKVIRQADLLVVPGAARRSALGRHGGRAHVVWNCPLRNEVQAERPRARTTIRLAYAGSITPPRLSLSWIAALSALPENVELDIFGYETIGHATYLQQLLEYAQRLGIANRIRYHGPVARRSLLPALAECDIGIATFDLARGDENMRSMVGPSNKPFDYMACGLPIVVTDHADWRAAFVEPGYATACDPDDAGSIASAVKQLVDETRRRAMGARARSRISESWNYDRLFDPVLKALSI